MGKLRWFVGLRLFFSLIWDLIPGMVTGGGLWVVIRLLNFQQDYWPLARWSIVSCWVFSALLMVWYYFQTAGRVRTCAARWEMSVPEVLELLIDCKLYKRPNWHRMGWSDAVAFRASRSFTDAFKK